jgi:hypothetical protein
VKPPGVANRTANDSLLQGLVGSPRRQILLFCRRPRVGREIEREFALVNSQEVRNTVEQLVHLGWLHPDGDALMTNRLAAVALTELVAELFGRRPDVGQGDDQALEASVALLRRTSSHQVLRGIPRRGQGCSTVELMARTGLSLRQAYTDAQAWTNVNAVGVALCIGPRNGYRWRRTGVVLPALGGYLNSLEGN